MKQIKIYGYSDDNLRIEGSKDIKLTGCQDESLSAEIGCYDCTVCIQLITAKKTFQVNYKFDDVGPKFENISLQKATFYYDDDKIRSMVCLVDPVLEVIEIRVDVVG